MVSICGQKLNGKSYKAIVISWLQMAFHGYILVKMRIKNLQQHHINFLCNLKKAARLYLQKWYWVARSTVMIFTESMTDICPSILCLMTVSRVVDISINIDTS